jgi:hypothetical protein
MEAIQNLTCRVSDLIQKYHTIDLRCLHIEKELSSLIDKLEEIHSQLRSLRNS